MRLTDEENERLREELDSANRDLMMFHQEKGWVASHYCDDLNVEIKTLKAQINNMREALEGMVNALRSGRLAYNTTPPCYEVLVKADKALIKE